MLTKDDLSQVEKIIEPIEKDVSALKIDFTGMKKDIAIMKKDISTLKKDTAETRNDIKTLIAYFDRDYIGLRKRVDRIEEKLGISERN